MTPGGIILVFAALAAHGHQVRTEKAEVTCMAQALYYEARGEGQNGQEAVAEVILQRVRSGSHPDTICGVVHEPRQFSFLTDGSTSRALDADAWQSAKQLAARIVRGEVVTSLTRRAQFYHQVDIQPAWANEMIQTAKIGNHVFYRPAGRVRATQVSLTGQPVPGTSSKASSA
jgi:spore germination cell wall hydrolase CwlJ-like protein